MGEIGDDISTAANLILLWTKRVAPVHPLALRDRLLSHPHRIQRGIYGIFMHPLCRKNVPLASLVLERAMYQLSAVGIGAVSVAFFLVILAGLVREMTRHKRRKS
jgi:hypothetical protein